MREHLLAASIGIIISLVSLGISAWCNGPTDFFRHISDRELFPNFEKFHDSHSRIYVRCRHEWTVIYSVVTLIDYGMSASILGAGVGIGIVLIWKTVQSELERKTVA